MTTRKMNDSEVDELLDSRENAEEPSPKKPDLASIMHRRLAQKNAYKQKLLAKLAGWALREVNRQFGSDMGNQITLKEIADG